ncbi:unnamed protein product [Calypogeia fissa]
MSGNHPEKRSFLHSASDTDSDVDHEQGRGDVGLANQLARGAYGAPRQNSYVTHDFKVFRAAKVDPDQNDVGGSSILLSEEPGDEREAKESSQRQIEASAQFLQGSLFRFSYRPQELISQSEVSHSDSHGVGEPSGRDSHVESSIKGSSSQISSFGDPGLAVTEMGVSIFSELEEWPTVQSPFSDVSLLEGDGLGRYANINRSSDSTVPANVSELGIVGEERAGSSYSDAEGLPSVLSAFKEIDILTEDGGRNSVLGSDQPPLAKSIYSGIDTFAEQASGARQSQAQFPSEIDLLGEVHGRNSYLNSSSELQSPLQPSVVEMQTFGGSGGERTSHERWSVSYLDPLGDDGGKTSSVGSGNERQSFSKFPLLDTETLGEEICARHGHVGSSSESRPLPKPNLADTSLQREYSDGVGRVVSSAENFEVVKEPLRPAPLKEMKRGSVTSDRQASHLFAVSDTDVHGDEVGEKNILVGRGNERRPSGKERVVYEQSEPLRDSKRTSVVFGGNERRPSGKELVLDDQSQPLKETKRASIISIGSDRRLSGKERVLDAQTEPLRDIKRESVISGRRVSRLPSASDVDRDPESVRGRGSVNQSSRRTSRIVSPPSEAEFDVQTRERDEYGEADTPEFTPRQSSLQRRNSIAAQVGEKVPPEWALLLLGCLLGLMTGLSVVLFNKGVHFIHDMAWAGTPQDGAAWFRLQQLIDIWHRVLLLPVVGGVVVGMMHAVLGILDQIKASRPPQPRHTIDWLAGAKPTMKATQAMVTLGTGCSLGPEGPSVDIGKAWANGLATVMKNNKERRIALVAAGAAAGISAGFNAPVSGMFFAIETVLRPQNAENSPPLTTAMIILASVISSTVSQILLEETPAFTVPTYELRSAAELPLYLLLGGVCGVVSVIFVRMTAYFTELFEFLRDQIGVPPTVTPAIGGLVTGVIALRYPGVLYWGFYNVDEILHSGKSAIAPGAGLVTQLICAKVVATAFSKGSGLVGGVYAPSLFIGAAVGSVYGTIAGKIIDAALPGQNTVAHPQAYALVGMAAMLAAVCSVPLTSVLLLFELTKDYHILLPLMGGIGVAIWVAAVAKQTTEKHFATSAPFGGRSFQPLGTDEEGVPDHSGHEQLVWRRTGSGTEVELCTLDDYEGPDVVSDAELKDSIKVSQAMSKTFVTVQAIATVKETIGQILSKQQRCALVVDENDLLEGIFTFSDLEREVMRAAESSYSGHRAVVDVDKMLVAAICSGKGDNQGQDTDLVVCFPDMSLRAIIEIMDSSGFKQLPVVARAGKRWQDEGRHVVGLINRDAVPRCVREEASKRIAAAILARDDEDDDGPLLDGH